MCHARPLEGTQRIGGAVPLRSRRPRYSAPGQLVLFDLLNPPPPPEPGTILTPRLPGGDTEQQLELLFGAAEFNPPLAAPIGTPGPDVASLLVPAGVA